MTAMNETIGRVLGGFALLALLLTAACGRPSPPRETGLSVATAMGGEAEGYLRADGPRPFVFPDDHGPHPGFRTEWWYLTGHLRAADGRSFGYQLTLFRNALSADTPDRESRWAAGEVYMGHFALTDVEGRRFHAFDRFGRAALDLAGARQAPFRVWLEDWSIVGNAEMAGAGASDPFPLRVRAADGDVAIDLALTAGKPPVLQGERGLSQKGPEPGNASYYYSLTRMPTTGSVRIGGQTLVVTGTSWMDREWSTSALGEDQAGWDWFALQFDDGRELMYYQIRRSDGTPDPFSKGTLVAVDGSSVALSREQVDLQVLDHWMSPRTGVRYPARWRLRIPSADLDLHIEPVLADQELDLAFRYWEGAVRVRSPAASGLGYVELTGYDNLDKTWTRR